MSLLTKPSQPLAPPPLPYYMCLSPLGCHRFHLHHGPLPYMLLVHCVVLYLGMVQRCVVALHFCMHYIVVWLLCVVLTTLVSTFILF
ncbi:hypothetical protein EDD17DRAFT_1673550 [Pisolithus thermaeus]|nr:hypothetical protein EDD17DRAFT_1673550 [Pisolithus thermaeus]